ncbi:acyltransferase [Pseudoalteromonas sp. SCQQ13]|uniref:acyltransferase n=1 Tax=Pseudoalteromonas sp. SCQQ13 TaxID=2792066 RepID=UPI0018CDEFE8|nr:acyltransferase [Pseudoalteromonas sp. SCQQ13]MBH0093520.1 acyltransferase [Pseudoalteromonas sp. SCQQ13]
MSGKKLFEKFKPLVLTFLFVFKIMPKFFRSFLWSISSPFEGNISLIIRYFILKSECEYCGDNVFIGKNVTMKNNNLLHLGNNISIHANCYIDSAGGIVIEDNISIAHNSSLISFEHTWGNINVPIKYNPTRLDKIIICKDVWVGCGVRILAGSKVNTRVIVAAGCVVKGELDEKSIYAGVPCKKIKDL